MRYPLLQACWLAACLPMFSTVLSAAEPLSLAPREGVVMLANGEVIAGTIIPAGDRYDVHLDAGEISLRKADVALVCGNVAECYRHRRAGIEPGRVQDHLDLAEWCLRNRLLDEAERELADARRADATHPKIRLLAARFELTKNPQSTEATVGERPVSHTPHDSVSRNLPPGTMETFTNTIQPLLLNNCSKSGCHASRAGGGLKLERIHPRFSGRSATQRNLEQVLLQLNRENPPESKLLQAPIRPHGTVTAPIFTDRQAAQYRQLVQWVYAVAGSRSPAEPPPSLAERTGALLQAIPGAAGVPAAEAGAVAPATYQEAVVQEASEAESSDPAAADATEAASEGTAPPNPLPPDATQPAGEAAATDPAAAPQESQSDYERAYTPAQLKALGIDQNGKLLHPRGSATRSGILPTESKVQRGAKLPVTFAPKDEFDPEVFNRRFFGK